MTGRTIERGLNAATVREILATQGFGTERGFDGPLLIALSHPLRLVWANPQATALFGTADAAELQARLFSGHGREALTAVIGHLVPNGGIRVQRLRLIDGFRTRSVTVAVSRNVLADGLDAVLLAIPATTAGVQAGTDASRNALAAERPGAEAHDAVSASPTPAPAVDPLIARGESRDPPPDLVALGAPRFLWRTDAAGRVLEIAGAPPRVPALAGLLGHHLATTASMVGADPEGAVAAAMASLANWRGVRTLWPVVPGWAVPIVFGAAVVRGAQREVAGYRGFGVCDFARLVPRDVAAEADTPPPPAPEDAEAVAPAPQPVAAVAPAAPSEAPGDEHSMTGDATPFPEPVESPHESHEPGDTAPPRFEPHDGAGVTPAVPSARIPYGSGKVVMLRPLAGLDAAHPDAGARRPGDGAEPQALDDKPGGLSPLSSAEQLAFDAIARALKASAEHKAASQDVPPLNDAEATKMWGALPLAVLVTCGGRPVFSNTSFAAITGFSSLASFEAVGGLPHLLGGLDVTQVAESDADRTFPIVDAAGEVLSVEGRVSILAWDGATADMLTFRPAADHVAEVQSLRLQIARLRTEAADAKVLLDRVADAAAIVDGQGRLLSLNSTGSRLFGREAGSTVGESIGILLTPESQNAALGAIFAAGNAGPDGADNRITVSGRQREGESRLALTMVTRALGHGRIAVVFHDGSEVEAARGEARLLRDELGAAGNGRVDFLAKVSHEIRTPLNAILGFAEIMLDERFGPIGNPRYKDYLGDIRSAGQHVNDLVSDLLDLSSVQAGQRTLTVVASDVNRIVGESVAELQAQAHRDRVIVRLSLTPHLPSALVDEAAMRQVMDNILSNAIRFNEPGGQVIVSTAVKDGGAITVRVRDTGIGMSEAELAIATEPFRQISTGKPAGGSGLGLPLTQALVEANGATMTISSRKNEGTLVEVVLRATPVQAMSVPAA